MLGVDHLQGIQARVGLKHYKSYTGIIYFIQALKKHNLGLSCKSLFVLSLWHLIKQRQFLHH